MTLSIISFEGMFQKNLVVWKHPKFKCSRIRRTKFQKNLVVWKLHYIPPLSLKLSSVSEELSSVETINAERVKELLEGVSEELSRGAPLKGVVVLILKA